MLTLFFGLIFGAFIGLLVYSLSHLVIYFFICFNSDSFSPPQSTSKVLFCLEAKDIQFTVTEEEGIEMLWL